MPRKVRRWQERPTSWPEPRGVMVMMSSILTKIGFWILTITEARGE